MSDLKQRLDREAQRVRATPDALTAVLRRAERRRAVHRLATIAVALLIAGAGIGTAVWALGGTGPDAIVPGGESGEFRAIWPQVERGEAEIAQSRADRGDDRLTWQRDPNEFLWRFANDGLRWVAVSFDELDEIAAASSGPFTVTLRGCPVEEATYDGDAEAWSCPEGSFREAEVTMERLVRQDPGGIWSVTGAFVGGAPVRVERSPLPPVDSPSPNDSDLPEEVGDFAWDFIQARNEERPVEDVLSTEAKRAYEEGEGGLSLYGYAAKAHSLTFWDWIEVSDGWRMVVGFQGSGSEFPDGGVIRETLLIGPGENSAGDSLDLVVLDAERDE